jgi:HSP20 family protein
LQPCENIGTLVQILIPPGTSRDLAADIRELFEDVAAHLDHAGRGYSREYQPPLDVRERDDAIEIVVEVCGVPADRLRVLFRTNVLVVVGEKAPAKASGEQIFHLVEREFGRFARCVQLAGAFDVGRAHATVTSGELTIVLPKLSERRGRSHRIPVQSADAGHRPPP